jgi:hypothetical protein
MSTDRFFAVLPTLFREIVDGSPDPAGRTYLLNRGDVGLLASLDRISAAEASTSHEGGAPIAAHVDHLRYALMILNEWAAGASPASQQMDWTASWKVREVSESEWRRLREELRREAAAWSATLRTLRELSEIEAGWLAGTVPHVAYHFGAIRQLARAARGPTAEDEARAEAALRAK